MQYMLYSREKVKTEEGKKRIHYLSWWIFDTISKSLVLASYKAGTLDSNDRTAKFTKQHSNIFSKVVKKLWEKLVSFICGTISSKDYEGELILNQNMAIFLQELFGLYDRGLSVELVMIFNKFCDRNIEEFPEKAEIISLLRLEHFKIIADYEHWISINLPQPLDFSLSSPNSLKILSERHVIAYQYINLCINEIKDFKSTNLSRMAINNIALILTKHDFDFTFNSTHSKHLPKIDKDLNVDGDEEEQHTEAEEKIENYGIQVPIESKKKILSTIYSPFFLLWIKNYSSMQKWKSASSKDEKGELYISLLWILKNLGIDNLKNWWKNESRDNLLIFLKTLQETIVCFEFEAKNSPKVTNWTHSTKDILSKIYTEAKSKVQSKFFDKNKSATLIEDTQSITSRIRSQNFQISLTILGIIENFINDYNEIFKIESSPSELFYQVLTTLILFSKTSQSSQFYSHWFSVFYKFVDSHHKFIYLQKNKILNKICKFTLNFCSYRCDQIRSEAASFMYYLILVFFNFIYLFF